MSINATVLPEYSGYFASMGFAHVFRETGRGGGTLNAIVGISFYG